MNIILIFVSLVSWSLFSQDIAPYTGINGEDERVHYNEDNFKDKHTAIGLLVRKEQPDTLEDASYCTATIVHKQYLLTAAHCVMRGYALYPSLLFHYFPAYGTQNKDNEELKISSLPDAIYIPDEYLEKKKECITTTIFQDSECSSNEFDIALIRLEEPVNSDEFKSLEIASITEELDSLKSILVAGFPGDKASLPEGDSNLPSFKLYESQGEANIIRDNEEVKIPYFKTLIDLTLGMSGSAFRKNGKVFGVFSGTRQEISTKTKVVTTLDQETQKEVSSEMTETKVNSENRGAVITPKIYDEIIDWMNLSEKAIADTH